MAKKTRTELSTEAVTTNLPDNNQELITPATERAQLASERESTLNYKDDITGSVGQALVVGADGESVGFEDFPSIGTGTDLKLTQWGPNSTLINSLATYETSNREKLVLNSALQSGSIYIQGGSTPIWILPPFGTGGDYTNKYDDIHSAEQFNIRWARNDQSSAALGEVDLKSFNSDIRIFDNTGTGLFLNQDGTIALKNKPQNPTLEVDYLSFANGGAATFSGNIGVGGGTPSIFTPYSVASFGSLSTTNNSITIASTTTGNGLIEFADGTAAAAYRGYIQYAHGTADSLTFGTAGSDRLTIASTGAATFSGQINANNGISFPNQSAGSGTVSSSVLNAYEEGTSTIYFRSTGQNPTPTATAYYTRIGNIVYYSFEGSINATINSNAYFDGLPFLPASGYPRSAFYVGWNSATHNSNGGNVYTSGTYAGTGFFWQRNAFALASYWYTGAQYLTVSGSYQI